MNKEIFRIEGEIKKDGLIERIPLTNKLLWKFVKIFLKVFFLRKKFKIWSIVLKNSYHIIIQTNNNESNN